MKPLVIGQAPSRGRDGEPPLSGRSGARLANLAGISLEEFLGQTDRVNLIERWPGRSGKKGDRFPAAEARARFHVILPMCSGHRVVLLGSHVAEAFRFYGRPFCWARSLTPVYADWAFCPHPSGVNLWWNDPDNVRAASEFWRNLLQTRQDFSMP